MQKPRWRGAFFNFGARLPIAGVQSQTDRALKRDEIRLNHHRALALCLSLISAQTRSAFVARENRYTLFRIML
jgi:hypothetical protein